MKEIRLISDCNTAPKIVRYFETEIMPSLAVDEGTSKPFTRGQALSLYHAAESELLRSYSALDSTLTIPYVTVGASLCILGYPSFGVSRLSYSLNILSMNP